MTDQHQQLGRLEADVIHLKTTLPAMEARLVKRLDRMEEVLGSRLNDHGGRIRKLEAWRSWIGGGLAALWGVVVIVFGVKFR